MSGEHVTRSGGALSDHRGAPVDCLSFFSPDYVIARERFRVAARAAGASLHALPLDAAGPDGGSLTIDIAWLGDAAAHRVLLHSSGLHGVEAFAGSAIQLALLAHPPALSADCALLIAHVLNPWGMAWLRRANENNVDLNRNFLGGGETWSGAPEIYRRLDSLLNPPSPPGFDFFYPRALWHALRVGFAPLSQAVAQGQYEFPRGLFYGGSALQPGPRRYLDWIARHLAHARYVFALDVHTGLGRRGEETLLPESDCATAAGELGSALGRTLARAGQHDHATYTVRGSMGSMIASVLRDAAVDFVVQELGTRPPLFVFHALREENRWHHYGGGGIDHPVKQRLQEALCPTAVRWRTQVVRRGVERARAAAVWAFEGHRPQAGE